MADKRFDTVKESQKVLFRQQDIEELVNKAVQKQFMDWDGARSLVYEAVEKHIKKVIQAIIRDEAFQNEIQNVITELVRENLRGNVQPFANTLWEHSSKKFERSLMLRLKELIALKTSTLQELSNSSRIHPVTKDEEFLLSINEELKRIEYKGEFRRKVEE